MSVRIGEVVSNKCRHSVDHHHARTALHVGKWLLLRQWRRHQRWVEHGRLEQAERLADRVDDLLAGRLNNSELNQILLNFLTIARKTVAVGEHVADNLVVPERITATTAQLDLDGNFEHALHNVVPVLENEEMLTFLKVLQSRT